MECNELALTPSSTKEVFWFLLTRILSLLMFLIAHYPLIALTKRGSSISAIGRDSSVWYGIESSALWLYACFFWSTLTVQCEIEQRFDLQYHAIVTIQLRNATMRIVIYVPRHRIVYCVKGGKGRYFHGTPSTIRHHSHNHVIHKLLFKIRNCWSLRENESRPNFWRIYVYDVCDSIRKCEGHQCVY